MPSSSVTSCEDKGRGKGRGKSMRNSEVKLYAGSRDHLEKKREGKDQKGGSCFLFVLPLF